MFASWTCTRDVLRWSLPRALALLTLLLLASPAPADVDVYYIGDPDLGGPAPGDPGPINWDLTGGLWYKDPPVIGEFTAPPKDNGPGGFAGHNNINAQNNGGGTIEITNDISPLTWMYTSGANNTWGNAGQPPVGTDSTYHFKSGARVTVLSELANGAWNSPNKGIMVQDEDTIINAGIMYVSRQPGTRAEYTMNGGILNVTNANAYGQGDGGIFVGEQGLSNGLFTQNAGDVHSDQDIRIGDRGTGVYNLNSGTMSMNRWLYIGRAGGEGGNALGTFNQRGGSVTVGDTSWIGDDQSANRGIYNMYAGTLNLAGVDPGTGTPGDGRGLRIGNRSDGEFHMPDNGIAGDGALVSTYSLMVKADQAGTGRSGLMTIDDPDAVVTVNRIVRVGDVGDAGVGTGTITQTAGYLEYGSGMGVNETGFIVGNGSGIGVYNISGGTLFDASAPGGGGTGSWNYIGNTGRGTMNLSGSGNVSFRGRTHIGANAGSVGTLNQTGGSFAVTDHELVIADGDANGVYNFSGGSSNVTNDVLVGHWSHDNGSQGELHMSGDALMNMGGNMRVGGQSFDGRASRGVVTQTDLSTVLVGSSLIVADQTNANGAGASNTSIGTYTLGGTATLAVTGSSQIGAFGTGTFNHNGGFHAIANGNLEIGVNPGSTGVYNLAGGLGNAVEVSNPGASLNVGPGGIGTMNVGAGSTVNVATVNIGGGTGGRINLNGTLDGVLGGLTTVNVNTSGTLAGGGVVAGTVNGNGGTITAGNSIGTITVGDLVLNSGSVLFELGAPGTSDLINVLGNLNLAGATTANLLNAGGMAVGSYTLIDYSTFSGSLANLAVGPPLPNPALQYTLVNNLGNTSIDLFISLAGFTWNVDGDGVWSAPGNWLPPGPPSGVDAISNFLGVITADRTITVDGARTVGTMTFDNAHKYTITGSDLTLQTSAGSATIAVLSGNHEISSNVNLNSNLLADIQQAGSSMTLSAAVTGAAGVGITKTGAGDLISHSPLNISGPVTVNGGAIRMAGVANLSGPVVVHDGGTLESSGATALSNTVDVGNAVGDNATLLVSGGTTTFTGGTMRAGVGVGATGNVNITGGTLSVGGQQLQIGVNGGTGAVNQSGGTLDNGGNNLTVGQDGTSNGRYTQTGGLNVNASHLILGGAGTANGFYELRGGDLTLAGNVSDASGGNSTLRINGGNLNLNPAASINVDQFRVGEDPGTNGAHSVGAGQSVGVGPGGEISVGRAGGIGLLDTAGSVQSGGNFSVGGWDGGTGRMNQNGGNVTVGNEMGVGVRGGTSVGRYDLNGGNLTVANWFSVGRDGGTGEFNINTAGTVQVNGAVFGVGGWGGAHGTVNHNSGTVIANETWVGLDPNGVGVLNTNGNLTANDRMGAGRNGGTGTINQNGGTVRVGNSFFLGNDGAPGDGTYNLNAGNLDLAFNGTADAFFVGVNGKGTFNMGADPNSVVEQKAGQGWNYIGQTGGNADGLVNMTGGRMHMLSRTHVGFTNETGQIGLNQPGKGVFNQSGGLTQFNQGNAGEGLVIGDGDDGNGNIAAAGGEGYYNLTGGRMEVGGDLAVAHWTSSHGELNIGPGTELTVQNRFRVGNLDGYGGNNKPATGIVRQTGGDVTVGLNVMIGVSGASTGTYSISGDGTLNAQGEGIQVAVNGGTTGTLNVSDLASVHGATHFEFGQNGTGTVNQSGGTVATDQWIEIGNGASAVGTYNMTGGSLSTGPGFDMIIGRTGRGTVNHSGGIVQEGWLRVGSDGSGQGTYNLSGDGLLLSAGEVTLGEANARGTFVQSGNSFHQIGTNLNIATGGGSIGTYRLEGGFLDMTGGDINYGPGTASFVMAGGTLHDAAHINFSLNQQGGTIEPGASPGTTNIAGNYTMGAAAAYAAEIMDLSGAGVGNDLLNISGAASLNGTLDVQDLGYVGTEALGDTFLVLTAAGGRSGTFSTVVLPALGGGKSWSVLYGANDVRLSVVPEPSTLVLCGIGLAGTLALAIRRRRRSA